MKHVSRVPRADRWHYFSKLHSKPADVLTLYLLGKYHSTGVGTKLTYIAEWLCSSLLEVKVTLTQFLQNHDLINKSWNKLESDIGRDFCGIFKLSAKSRANFQARLTFSGLCPDWI